MARRKTKTSTGLQNPKAKVNVSITPQSKSTLEKISEETGLSRSALFEGILNGTICLSSQGATQVINLTPTSENEHLEVSVADEVASTSSTSESASTTANGKEEKEQISALEQEIKDKESQISKSNDLNHFLQQKLDDQIAIVANLKNELDQAKNKSKKIANKEDLTSLINQKEATIKQLNQEINQLKQQSNQSNQTANLQEQLNTQRQLVDNLKQQIQVLQSQTKTSVSSQKTISDLEHHARQQKDTIARLEVRIAELQSIASIGYHAINKWRSKVYQ